MKLVDLVTENNTSQSSAGLKNTLNLSFKVMNETNNDVVKYEGLTPDGNELPEWIKVDTKTGETTAELPEGEEVFEFIIIATDQNNEKREIAIRIDPEEIQNENNLISNQNDVTTNVSESGDVTLIKKNSDGSIDKTSSKALNLNNKSDIKTIVENAESDFVYTLNSVEGENGFTVEVPEGLNNSIFNVSKIALADGTDAPSWVNYNAISGEIVINPPEDINSIDLKLIIDDGSTISVKDLEVTFERENLVEEEITDQFIGFKDQLDNEASNWDDYGSKIINRL